MSDKYISLESLKEYNQQMKETYIEPLQEEINGIIRVIFKVTTEESATITLKELTGMTKIDWGDGTVNNELTHTYTEAADKFECKIYGAITTIADGAFWDCTALASVIIPDSIVRIGQNAFYSCNNLTNITIGNGVKHINRRAFYWCENLTNIMLPHSLISIGEEAFQYCSSLTSITIPDSVTSIYSRAFSSCGNLTSITTNSITPPDIYANAFEKCTSLTKILVPAESLEAYKIKAGWSNYADKIDTYAYVSELPDAIEKWDSSKAYSTGDILYYINPSSGALEIHKVIADMPAGEDIYDPSYGALLTISHATFADSASTAESAMTAEWDRNYKTIANVEDLEAGKYNVTATSAASAQYAYYDQYDNPIDMSSKVDKKTVTSEMILTLKPDGSSDNLAYSVDATSLSVARRRNTGALAVATPENEDEATPKSYVDDADKRIQAEADGEVTSLNVSIATAEDNIVKIDFLTGVTEIDWGDGIIDSTSAHSYSEAGDYTIKIYGCTAITETDGAPFYFVRDGDVYDNYSNLNLSLSRLITHIGNWGLAAGIQYDNFAIPDTVKVIGANAFKGCDFVNLTIGYGVTEIGEYVFSDCLNLEVVTINAKIPPTLGTGAFDNCPNLTRIIVPTESLEAYKIAWADYATLIDAYAYISNAGGGSSVDLSNYYTKSEVDSTFALSEDLSYITENIGNGQMIAGKAKADQNGNIINETYATKDECATAKTTADNALAAAESASGVASDAQSAADNALSVANDASGAASSAQGSADDALAAANDAQSTADTAQSGVDNIVNGTTIVPKAYSDQNGNNIVDTYATKTALNSKKTGLINIKEAVVFTNSTQGSLTFWINTLTHVNNALPTASVTAYRNIVSNGGIVIAYPDPTVEHNCTVVSTPYYNSSGQMCIKCFIKDAAWVVFTMHEVLATQAFAY